ncbi:MAG: cytochrome c [Bdellovibrionaceae bacterium]|nr:cytochrome c [Pseudobdellovibrionaceae bacterium]
MMARIVFITGFSLFLFACNGGKNQTNIELMPDMFDQESLKSQDWDPKQGGKGSNLVPPENTVPRGIAYPKHMEDMTEAEEKLKNPYNNDFTPPIIELGKSKYEVYCGLCHGPQGDGKGLVGLKMLVPPRNFLEDRVKNFSDGRIYWAIVKGMGTMGSYANQLLTEKERWAVVNYVRTLQKQSQ